MAYISPSKLVPPRQLLRLEYKPAHLATLAGVELSMGRHRAAERLSDIAEELRLKLSTAEVAQ